MAIIDALNRTFLRQPIRKVPIALQIFITPASRVIAREMDSDNLHPLTDHLGFSQSGFAACDTVSLSFKPKRLPANRWPKKVSPPRFNTCGAASGRFEHKEETATPWAPSSSLHSKASFPSEANWASLPPEVAVGAERASLRKAVPASAGFRAQAVACDSAVAQSCSVDFHSLSPEVGSREWAHDLRVRSAAAPVDFLEMVAGLSACLPKPRSLLPTVDLLVPAARCDSREPLLRDLPVALLQVSRLPSSDMHSGLGSCGQRELPSPREPSSLPPACRPASQEDAPKVSQARSAP